MLVTLESLVSLDKLSGPSAYDQMGWTVDLVIMTRRWVCCWAEDIDQRWPAILLIRLCCLMTYWSQVTFLALSGQTTLQYSPPQIKYQPIRPNPTTNPSSHPSIWVMKCHVALLNLVVLKNKETYEAPLSLMLKWWQKIYLLFYTHI